MAGTIRKNLGPVTAYKYAVQGGYTGTEEEYAELMASYATVAEEAEGYAEQAEAAKDLAESARDQAAEWASGSVGGDPSATNNAKYYSEQAAEQASEATRQAGLADASAIAAGASEGAAAGSASTASTKAGEAASSASAAAGSASTASTKAGEASASATNANTAKVAAQAAQTAAETAQGKAEDAQDAAEAAAEQAEATLNSYAKVDGSYSSMTVGNAEQLVATVAVEDSVPYNFRTSGGTADIGDREVDKIVGGTVAWNQAVQNGNFADGTTGWSVYNAQKGGIAANNGILTYTASEAGSSGYMYGCRRTLTINSIPGRKYMISFMARYSFENSKASFEFGGSEPNGIVWKALTPNTWTRVEYIGEAKANATSNLFMLKPKEGSLAVGDTMDYQNVQLYDLTQLFGSTIADYIYSLETATPGAGVAWFRKLFPKPYYAYNPGELMSVQAAAHKMVGFNAWDEETEAGYYDIADGAKKSGGSWMRSKNYIPCVPNTSYCYTQNTGGSGALGYMLFYDANKNYLGSSTQLVLATALNGQTFTTPQNAYYMAFYLNNGQTTGACINLSWDGERDGEYAPYEAHTYPLDDSLTLRGIPKLDSGNGLYYDGDTYESDGTVTRRFDTKDLGSFSWNKDVNRPGVFYSATFQTLLKQYGRIVCPNYLWRNLGVPSASNLSAADKTISLYPSYGGGYLFIVDIDKAEMSVTDFETAVTGIEIVYERATTTTETADPFQSPQWVDDFGTEEYVDAAVVAETRDVAIPVGHDTLYQANLRAKLEMAPDSPDGDGDYIVRQTNGQNAYIPLMKELPTAPTTEGTYHLKATVTSGGVTLTWEADT